MRSYRYNIGLFLLSVVVFAWSCSSKQQNSNSGSSDAKIMADNLPHDPFSSRLVAAKELVKAKDFKTKLLNGETFKLSAHQGKVIVLNIWATWCAPCVEEMPDLVDIYKTYHDQGLTIIGISVDKQGRSVVVPFVKKYDITYPISIDDGTIQKKYPPTMGIPTTYIIGKKGNLRYYAAGALTKKELKPRIEKLLAE